MFKNLTTKLEQFFFETQSSLKKKIVHQLKGLPSYLKQDWFRPLLVTAHCFLVTRQSTPYT